MITFVFKHLTLKTNNFIFYNINKVFQTQLKPEKKKKKKKERKKQKEKEKRARILRKIVKAKRHSIISGLVN